MVEDKMTTMTIPWSVKKEFRTFARYSRETDADVLKRMIRLTRRVKHEKDVTYHDFLKEPNKK